jgi:hypothetical protein
MALAARALIPLPPAPAITCHVAVWYWAAQEAQALGLTQAKSPMATLVRIANMPGGAQGAMLALAHAGMANYVGPGMPPLPPPGTVFRWNTGATHAAIVTGADAITGHNQLGFFNNVPGVIRCTAHRADFNPPHTLVYLIPEATIVNAAGLVFNL